MTARLPAGWDRPGSKMRNKPVWECPKCGATYTNGKPAAGLCPYIPCSAKLVYHQSQKEYRRWCDLKQLEKAGQIRGLERQVRFPLQVNGHVLKTPKGRDMVYVADIVYEDLLSIGIGGNVWSYPIVEDAKGRKSGNAYDLFWLKREILRANGIEVREI